MVPLYRRYKTIKDKKTVHEKVTVIVRDREIRGKPVCIIP